MRPTKSMRRRPVDVYRDENDTLSCERGVQCPQHSSARQRATSRVLAKFVRTETRSLEGMGGCELGASIRHGASAHMLAVAVWLVLVAGVSGGRVISAERRMRPVRGFER